MCRSIKTLRSKEALATADEIEAAALQFVRKISGYRQPSRKNEDAFFEAVREITGASEKLLDALARAGANGASAAHAHTEGHAH